MGRDRKARFRFQESREDTDEKWDGKWDGKNGTESDSVEDGTADGTRQKGPFSIPGKSRGHG